jgi:hypothetical protein
MRGSHTRSHDEAQPHHGIPNPAIFAIFTPWRLCGNRFSEVLYGTAEANIRYIPLASTERVLGIYHCLAVRDQDLLQDRHSLGKGADSRVGRDSVALGWS